MKPFMFSLLFLVEYISSGFARLPIQSWDFKLLAVRIIKCCILYVQSVHSDAELDGVVTFRRVKHSELNDLLSN